MAQLRARVDVILVVEQDGNAVQHEFFTTLKDQLEVTKRFPKIEQAQASEYMTKLVFCAAIRTGATSPETKFDDFVDTVIDMQIDEAPPLARSEVSKDS